MPMLNGRGGQYYYDLHTESVFTGGRAEALPMPELVIQKIISTWNRELPARSRALRAGWKLNRTGPDHQLPVNSVEYDKMLNHTPAMAVKETVEQAPELPDLLEAQGVAPEGEIPGETAVRQPQNTVQDQLDGHDDGIDDWTGMPELIANEGDVELDDNTVSVKEPRRSARLAGKRVDAHQLRVYRMSLKKALKLNKRASRDAVMKELKQMLDLRVWEYISKANLSKTQMKKVIRSLMFLKEKRDAEGLFLKMKARLVAGGDMQDKSIYDNLSSPTVSLESVFIILAIAAIERRKVITVDITGAYLECSLPEDDVVIMELDPLVTKLLQELDPDAKQYETDKGGTLVRLKKALYGCVQSSRLWYERLRGALEAMGFEVNPYDMCVFNAIVNGVQVTMAFHVDDLLITSIRDDALDEVIEGLKKEFVAVTVTRGSKHSYLAMNLEILKDEITVDMSGYLQSLLAERKLRLHKSPASANLCDDHSDSPMLTEQEQKDFHSDVAKTLFLAKRVGLMCLAPVSVLSSRVLKPTKADQMALERMLGYLQQSQELKLRFKCGGHVDPKAYIDASWATHFDGHGRTGVVIMMANCAIAGWSFKQKMVTRSSTESEIVALSDGITQVMWLRYFLTAQGYTLPPTTVYQDNSAVMALMRGGRNTHQRTKHLDVRYFYARELEADGDICLEWLSTKHMIADIMTKPLQGSLFTTLTKQLTGN